MKALKILTITLIALVVGIIVVGLALSSTYNVSRSIVIEASPAEVFSNVANFKQWKHWGVWFQRDPDMILTYSGEPASIGHKSVWKSDTQGNGEMKLTAIEKNKALEYDLYFPDIEMSSKGSMVISSVDNGTKVTWADSGDVGYDIVGRYFILFIEDMLGPDFEQGLKNLKERVEASKN
ncbi:SRPBCC family protein [Pleionea sediminis]|uniref:SRPBCC family protein n=1 Tax=Pleionea sediminis TaxID=2569479 RepID=UPI001184E6AC|nr:SRPBCC family protein [Pleionea sediminis]